MSTREPRKRPLRRRFVIAISTLVAFLLLAQTTVMVIFGGRHLRDEIEQRAASYAELAVEPICDAWDEYSMSGVGKFNEIVLQTANLNHDLKALAIYTSDGELLFHSDELGQDGRASELGPLGLGPRRLSAAPGHEIRSWIEKHPSGGEYFVVLAPRIGEWGAFRYAVAFYFSYDGLRSAVWSVAWQLAGLALGAVALGVAWAYLLSAQSLVPVEKLTSGARRLADGHLDERIALRTGDEFEVLAGTLDQMAERLATTIRDLETYNARLNRLNEELRELDRVKNDILANVSHELRTPLTTISGYVEALREGMLGSLNATQDRSLVVVDRNVGRLKGTIEQLLSSSRMSSGRRRAELKSCPLEPVIRNAVESLQSAVGPQFRLECEVPPQLPPVVGDAESLVQVFENLLTNAVKFSPEGGRIRVTVREVEDGIEAAVSDQGIGIPEPEQEKIFDRFYQVDGSSNRRFGGLGLGLAIVREILELHHTTIRLRSQVGAGSTFSFVLPVAAGRDTFPVGEILLERNGGNGRE